MRPPTRRRIETVVGPLTPAGRVVALLGIVGYVTGAWLDWTELVGLGVACLLALVAGVPLVVGRYRLSIERSLSPRRVSVGEVAEATLVLQPRLQPRPGRGRDRARGLDRARVLGGNPLIEDQVDGRRIVLGRPDEPSLPETSERVISYRVPTDRRGVHTVGPAVAVKADRLGLLRRDVRQTGVDHLWVRPRTVVVSPLGVGFAQNLEGPDSDSSPAGDVSFHALRAYEPGDDHRHIHWPSSARAGTLMVRQHVDNRLPCLTLLLDDRPGPDFELALEVAASVVTAHVLAGLPLTVVFASRALSGPAPALLDEFCLLQPRATEPVAAGPTTAGPLVDWVDRALTGRPDTSVLVLVTAAATPIELAQASSRVQGRAHTLMIRAGGEPLPGRIGQATIVRAESLEGFACSWNHRFRP